MRSDARRRWMRHSRSGDADSGQRTVRAYVDDRLAPAVLGEVLQRRIRTIRQLPDGMPRLTGHFRI